ncbi:hypothetical protein ACFLZ4_01505 [Patescibacteria group bacterium]
MLETISEIAEDAPPESYFEISSLKEERVNSEEEIHRAILRRAIETKERVGTSDAILYTACNSLTVETLIRFNLEALKSENKKEEFYEKSKRFTNVIRAYNEGIGNRWEDIKNGLYAEVAVAVSLKQLGFDVYLPDFEDDTRGKIDLWIKDPNESENPYIVPIQIKSSANIRAVVAGRIDDEKNLSILKNIEENWDYGRPHPNNTSAERLKKLQDKLARTSYSMLEYLTSLKKETDKKILPIAIVVPGGEGAENAMFSTHTASPSGNTFEQGSLASEIYEKLEKIIYKKEKE